MTPDPSKRPLSTIQAMGMVWDIVLLVIVPTVLFAWGGRWLDKRYDLSPWCTIAGFVLALIVVGVGVYKKGKEISKRL